jgi:DNA polymerase
MAPQNEDMAGRKLPIATAASLVPTDGSWDDVREAAKSCKACALYKTGTQTVFGEGGQKARIVFVGEQPGNEEDLSGRPFVGPAGRILDEALEAAEIDRGLAYVTNVVKHFKWEPRGKRRIHAKPNQAEITACMPWLNAELAMLRPDVIVCLGATAAQALLGKQFRVTKQRGEWVDSPLAPHVMATVHPSAILRAEDDRREQMRLFIEDLKKIAAVLGTRPKARRAG